MSHQTALLVIDAQVSILDDSNAYRAPETLARIADLLDRARTAGTPVIFIQHDHDRYEPMMPGAPGWQIHPAVAPHPGETVVRKRAADAFFGTELRAKLDDRAVTRLVVTGCETQYCVDATVRRSPIGGGQRLRRCAGPLVRQPSTVRPAAPRHSGAP